MINVIHKAAGIIIKERKLLVARAKNKEIFMSPGGKVQERESDAEALIRELHEEFTIEVHEPDLEDFGVFSAPAAGDEERQVFIQVFLVHTFKGHIVPSGEIEEIRFVNSLTAKHLQVGSIFAKDVIPKLKELDLID